MRIRVITVACLATSLLLGGCSFDLGPVVRTEKVTVSTRDAVRAAQLISEYRRAHGLASVSADNQLNEAAVHQARAVAQAGSLSHGDFGGRMTSYGIGGAAAENLTAGSDEVAAAIGRWKTSPAHNANLLMKEARRVGLARADTPGEGYRHYWALVLAQ